jgi:hypothetical protein
MTNSTKAPAPKALSAKASLDAALAMLAKAGALEAKAGAALAAAKSEETNAQAMAIAAMTSKGILGLTFSYDVKDSKGDIVEHVKSAKLLDYVGGFKKEGKEYRAKATAFRQAVLPRFFNVSGDNDSVWAMFRQTFPAALALTGEAMTATVGNDGKLVLSGGTGETAKKLRDAAAKSVSALKSAAKGEAAKRKPSLPGEKEAKEETRPATLTDILSLVRDFLTQAIAEEGETDYAPKACDDALIAEIAVLAKGYGELASL